jgi:hypothetical protein
VESPVNRRTYFVVCLFTIAFITSSCSQLSFVSGRGSLLKISPDKLSEHVVEIEGVSDIYFWGLSPGISRIDLDDLQGIEGENFPSFLTVEQSVSFKSMLYAFVTLGLYCPVDYKIKMLVNKGAL